MAASTSGLWSVNALALEFDMDRRTVTQVPGNHGLRTDPEAVADAVRDWFARVLPQEARAQAG